MKHLFITDLEWLILPPVLLRQFRIFRQEGKPIAFASWAYLSEEVEDRMAQGIRRMSPLDWKSGESPWLIDLIAPFGGGDVIATELREQVFAGQQVKTLQPAADGQGMAVVTW